MGNGHGMGSCECKCPEISGETEAQVQIFGNGHTSFLRRTPSEETKDPIKSASALQGYLNGNRLQGQGGETLDSARSRSSASSSSVGRLSPRCKVPFNPNKVHPVPKLDLPPNVYQEPMYSKQGRAARGKSSGNGVYFADQAQFAHLPPLPKGWMRVRSKTTGAIYYCQTTTGETTFIEPTSEGASRKVESSSKEKVELPPGWHLMVSRSTGRPYYWNSDLNVSQFEHPSSPRQEKTETLSDTSDLPSGWVRLMSRTTGRPYYFNSKLQLSQFKHPGECSNANEMLVNGSLDTDGVTATSTSSLKPGKKEDRSSSKTV